MKLRLPVRQNLTYDRSVTLAVLPSPNRHKVFTLRELATVYVARPFRLIMANATFLVLVVLLFLFDQTSNGLIHFTVAITPQWTYTILPQVLRKVVLSRTLLAWIVVAYLVKSVIVFVVSANMVHIYQRNRKNLITSLISIRPADFGWFM